MFGELRFHPVMKVSHQLFAVLLMEEQPVFRRQILFPCLGIIPVNAEVQAALGSVQTADASFQRATDLVEGLLVNAPSSQVKSGMIGASSQIYLGHFRLAWNRMHDAPYAFSIIEGARGRALLDSIRYARQSAPVNAAQTRGEIEIVRLQRSLMHDHLTNAQTRHVVDQLDEANMQLSPIEYARQRKEMSLVRRRPVSAAALEAQLRPGEALVEYVMDEKGSYAIEISRAGLKVHSRWQDHGHRYRPHYPADATVIDLPVATCLPGLIDVHVHLTSDASTFGYPTLGISVPRSTVTGVKNARLTLLAGFTTVRNVGADQSQMYSSATASRPATSTAPA